MPIIDTDLILHGAASRPEDDTTTSGGAIDTAARPLESQLSATSVVAIVSDGADTRTVTITGRLASGAIDTEGLVANGTTEVVGLKSFERILKITTTSNASRTITVRQGAGGTTRHTINPNETAAFIQFIAAASEAGATTRYEKLFWKNNHGTLSLLSAKVQMTANPSGKMAMGIATAVDDTVSVANRKTAPGGITFVGAGVQQNVPGTDLAAGAAIGTWGRLSLLADDAALKTSHTLELAGQTT